MPPVSDLTMKLSLVIESKQPMTTLSITFPITPCHLLRPPFLPLLEILLSDLRLPTK
jgi:hypothetical protein